ncbi:hypothetical protein [Pseudomonas sp. MWU13-2517]|uniref:hypothetical protein n=1 Tax=Pseudomonas sp. MWU13-2517 TaxID=2929055 RepID=UPI0020105D58|nr:hypothetical protein [Pseudomonas sp. MWU13-2517]
MINGFSANSNAMHYKGDQFEPRVVKNAGQQQMALADSVTASSTPSAPSSNEIAALMQALATLIQMLNRLFSRKEVVNEQPVKPHTVAPAAIKKQSHEVSIQSEPQKLAHISSTKKGEMPACVWVELNRNKRYTDNESAIKAAMMKYGQSPLGIYSDIKNHGDGYHIEMRDGFKLTLSPQEIEKAQKRTGIWSPSHPDMAMDVNFMHAASIKRVQLETGLDSFDHALDVVQSGKDVGNGFKRLGLEAYVRRTTWPELRASGGKGVVFAPGGVQFGYDGNVDCCSRRSGIGIIRTKGGPKEPYPCDALELT